MKNFINTLALALVLVSWFTAQASADSATSKPATRIDFNRMIEDNNKIRQELTPEPSTAAQTSPSDAERKRVTDFIDVEVGWSEAPKVTDRRYNSVGEPEIVELSN